MAEDQQQTDRPTSSALPPNPFEAMAQEMRQSVTQTVDEKLAAFRQEIEGVLAGHKSDILRTIGEFGNAVDERFKPIEAGVPAVAATGDGAATAAIPSHGEAIAEMREEIATLKRKLHAFIG